MATIASGSYPQEMNFIDNPIVIGLENFNFPEGAVFRQVVIQVDVSPTYTGASATSYRFTADVTDGSTVWVDISSALRAAMNAWSPGAESVDAAPMVVYPYAMFVSKAWEYYMLDGEVYEEASVEQVSSKAYYGGLSQYERMTVVGHPADYLTSGTHMSRKPKIGELIKSGGYRTYGYFRGEDFVTSVSRVTESGEDDYGSYLVTDMEDAVQLLFVNSLGMIEAITAFPRESLSYNVEGERKSLVTSPSFRAVPDRTTTKHGRRPVMEMSSGIVTREWADWWVTEFLMAKRYWVLRGTGRKLATDGTWTEYPLWLPCTIMPTDEEVLVYDRAKQELPHVDFTVEVAAEGSLMNVLI